MWRSARGPHAAVIRERDTCDRGSDGRLMMRGGKNPHGRGYRERAAPVPPPLPVARGSDSTLWMVLESPRTTAHEGCQLRTLLFRARRSSPILGPCRRDRTAVPI